MHACLIRSARLAQYLKEPSLLFLNHKEQRSIKCQLTDHFQKLGKYAAKRPRFSPHLRKAQIQEGSQGGTMKSA